MLFDVEQKCCFTWNKMLFDVEQKCCFTWNKMLFHVKQQLHMLTPTVLNQGKLLVRLRKMLFHVEQNAVSRETDLIRTECCSNAQRFERSVIRMERPSWLVE